MKKPQPPCLDCKNRALGCHGSCIAYKAFQNENQAYSDVIRGEKTKKNLSMTAVCHSKDRWLKAVKDGRIKK